MDLEKYFKKHGVEGDLGRARAFEMVEIERDTMKNAAHEVRVTSNTISNWKKEKWWLEARNELLKEKYESLKGRAILKGNEVIEKLIQQIVDADPDKSSTGKSTLIKTLLSMTNDPGIIPGGKGGEVNVSIDQRSVVIGETLDMDKVRNASEAEKKEILLGNIPSHFRKDT